MKFLMAIWVLAAIAGVSVGCHLNQEGNGLQQTAEQFEPIPAMVSAPTSLPSENRSSPWSLGLQPTVPTLVQKLWIVKPQEQGQNFSLLNQSAADTSNFAH